MRIEREKGSNCKGIMGLLFGHNFVPCYNRTIIPPSLHGARLEGSIKEMIKALSKVEERYVHSICRRCGKVINEKG